MRFLKKALKGSKDWAVIDFPRTAALDLYKPSNFFIVKELERIYNYRDETLYGNFSADQERGKLNFFYDFDQASASSFRNYCVNMIPDNKKIEDDKKTVVQPKVFKKYLDDAVDLSLKMIKEAVSYMENEETYSNKTAQDKRDLYQEKCQAFPLLRRNWNMDCGIGFKFKANSASANYKSPKAVINIPVEMQMVVV